MNDVAAFLNAMHEKGVSIWTDEGQLHYRTPKGKLTPGDTDALRALKADIIQFLSRSKSLNSGKPPMLPRASSDLAPLTFAQQSWWDIFSLLKMTDRSRRSCATATRISGRLQLQALERSFDELVRRHESLRTQIVSVDGTAMQKIHQPDKFDLNIIDLTAMSSANREAEAKRLVEELVNEKIDVTVAPLFGARLLKLGDDDYVLVVAMDHIIADGFSIAVLARDIWTLYTRFSQGMNVSLPQITMQLADYAVWQKETSEWWTNNHGVYWQKHLADAPRVRFPIDQGIEGVPRFKSGKVQIQFGRDLSSQLREISRRERSTLSMTVLAVYIASLLRWQQKWELVVNLIVNGRHCPELENTVGFIASSMYLRVELGEEDTFSDLLKRVTKEYFTAYNHYDFGRLSAPVPGPEFKRCTAFNWQTWSRGNATATSSWREVTKVESGIKIMPFPFEFSEFEPIQWDGDPIIFDGDPGVAFSDTADGISGLLWYRADLYKPSTMELFAKNLRSFAEAVAGHSEVNVASVCIPSSQQL